MVGRRDTAQDGYSGPIRTARICAEGTGRGMDAAAEVGGVPDAGMGGVRWKCADRRREGWVGCVDVGDDRGREEMRGAWEALGWEWRW